MFSPRRHGFCWLGKDLTVAFESPDTMQSADGATSDLQSIPSLTDAEIARVLRTRHASGACYTYSGPRTVVSINPYDWAVSSHLYSEGTMAMYDAAGEGCLLGGRRDLPPHLYAVAEQARRRRGTPGRSQALIVGGESGAGKTEAVKILLRYVCERSGGGGRIISRLIELNPLLEAFGNASTALNHNSSRFGKLITLTFAAPDGGDGGDASESAQHARVCGGRLSTYLLEKVRVVRQADGEASFHIFHQLMSGLPHAEAARLRLPAPSSCVPSEGPGSPSAGGDGTHARVGLPHCCAAAAARSPSRAAGSPPSRTHGRAAWEASRRAALAVGVSAAELDGICELLAAIVHLTTVHFVRAADSGRKDSGGKDGGRKAREARRDVGSGTPPARLARAAEDVSLVAAASLLGLPLESLRRTLLTRSLEVRSQTLECTRSVEQARGARDAICKRLYSTLFEWVVRRINECIAPAPSAPSDEAAAAVSAQAMALLDLFGFESMASNSFEQLVINYANERLQAQFNADVIAAAEEEARSEGIELSGASTDYVDNAECIALFEGGALSPATDRRTAARGAVAPPPGLLSLLNDECALGDGHDANFLLKLAQVHRANSHLRIPFVASGGTHVGGVTRARTRSADSVGYGGARGGVSSGASGGGASGAASRLTFTISHYAGAVTYDAHGFREKNADVCEAQHLETLRSASHPLMASLLAAHDDAERGRGGATAHSKQGGTPTLSRQFVAQLRVLVTTLAASECQWIRCIKPNAQALASVWEHEYVHRQLAQCGVFASARAARRGYDHRMELAFFLCRYRCLELSTCHAARHGLRTRVRSLCANSLGGAKLGGEGCISTEFQVGHTKIFLSGGALQALDAQRRAVQLAYVPVLQAAARRQLAFSRARMLRRATQSLQMAARAWLARRALAATKLAAALAEAEQQRIEAEAALAAEEAAEARARSAEAQRSYSCASPCPPDSCATAPTRTPFAERQVSSASTPLATTSAAATPSPRKAEIAARSMLGLVSRTVSHGAIGNLRSPRDHVPASDGQAEPAGKERTGGLNVHRASSEESLISPSRANLDEVAAICRQLECMAGARAGHTAHKMGRELDQLVGRLHQLRVAAAARSPPWPGDGANGRQPATPSAIGGFFAARSLTPTPRLVFDSHPAVGGTVHRPDSSVRRLLLQPTWRWLLLLNLLLVPFVLAELRVFLFPVDQTQDSRLSRARAPKDAMRNAVLREELRTAWAPTEVLHAHERHPDSDRLVWQAEVHRADQHAAHAERRALHAEAKVVAVERALEEAETKLQFTEDVLRKEVGPAWQQQKQEQQQWQQQRQQRQQRQKQHLARNEGQPTSKPHKSRRVAAMRLPSVQSIGAALRRLAALLRAPHRQIALLLRRMHFFERDASAMTSSTD